ncbi:uncharacterized protein B0H18DRAFT_1005683 [Fomitopsis serialis]|uniref:uncharacterized protein n=1 Tax=Fomitopsis serialis TaxID=139415 RepID=UPI002008434A|nr:uncharacterized protein B0H18DRAFT_1005683 [Neoantrodia serialis]KAH9926808.1 hypothetical protein B0H18DRAFT_1005683 [Neoantrodia serialis]
MEVGIHSEATRSTARSSPTPALPYIPPEEETAIRHLTFWRDSFSVEDGDLMRYDDPTYRMTLTRVHAAARRCTSSTSPPDSRSSSAS